MNPLQRALRGPGRLPADLRAALAAEEALVLEEGLTGSVTFRNYQAPHQHVGLRKDAVSGAIAVTSQRFVVWAGRYKHIDVPHYHPLRAGIEVTAERPDRVCFAYSPGAANRALSGRVEVRLRTAQAARVAELLDRFAEG